MSRLIDLTNKRFGRLFVVSRGENQGNKARWNCWCDCGNEVLVQSYNLQCGNSQSCGCLHTEVTQEALKKATTTHGLSKSYTYVSWEQLRQRCFNPNHHAWDSYGGRGITVCKRWDSFENFYADMGERPTGTSIDRIDPNGNYEPSNCRWADEYTQCTNRRTKAKA